MDFSLALGGSRLSFELDRVETNGDKHERLGFPPFLPWATCGGDTIGPPLSVLVSYATLSPPLLTGPPALCVSLCFDVFIAKTEEAEGGAIAGAAVCTVCEAESGQNGVTRLDNGERERCELPGVLIRRPWSTHTHTHT